jgi:hypothetical protein
MLLLTLRYVGFLFFLSEFCFFALYFVVSYFVALSHPSCLGLLILLALAFSICLPPLQVRKGREAGMSRYKQKGRLREEEKQEKT